MPVVAARARPGWLAFAGAVLAGLLQALSLAAPWDGQPLWWLQLLAQTVFAALLWRQDTARRAALTGWLFATAWLAATFGWLFTSMHTYGGLPAPLALAAVLALAGFLALYTALVSALFFKLKRPVAHYSWALNAIVFSALWLLAELARGVWLTGFPWGATGYAHGDGPLAAYAPWVGVYGMGAMAALLAMLLAQAWWPAGQREARQGLGHGQAGPAMVSAAGPLAAVLLLAALLPGGLDIGNQARLTPQDSAGVLSLTLLQGAIPQDEKFEQGTGVAMALQWYGQALREARESLVVAPETALPLLPQDMPEGYWAALQAHVDQRNQPGGDQGGGQGGGTAVLIGTPLGSLAQGYTNSVYGLQPGQAEPYRYDKHHLVPFGEFIPPFFRWFTDLMHIPLGDFNRGSLGQPSMAWQGQRIAPNICYEDLFGEELGVRFADERQAPTMFVNVSNLAWFGDGQAIDQHLQISRLRALEFARPMVRATNTGATVVIDHRGQVTASFPRSKRGVLRTEVEGRHGLTPFAWWVSRFGLWPLWLLALAVVALAARGRSPRLPGIGVAP